MPIVVNLKEHNLYLNPPPNDWTPQRKGALCLLNHKSLCLDTILHEILQSVIILERGLTNKCAND
jgi:hypothetical protein